MKKGTGDRPSFRVVEHNDNSKPSAKYLASRSLVELAMAVDPEATGFSLEHKEGELLLSIVRGNRPRTLCEMKRSRKGTLKSVGQGCTDMYRESIVTTGYYDIDATNPRLPMPCKFSGKYKLGEA